MDLVSHTTYIVCVNFIHERRDLQLKSTPNDRFFKKLFMAISFTLWIFARNLLRGSRQRNIFIFPCWCLNWNLNRGVMSIKPTLFLLDSSDFAYFRTFSKIIYFAKLSIFGIFAKSIHLATLSKIICFGTFSKTILFCIFFSNIKKFFDMLGYSLSYLTIHVGTFLKRTKVDPN